MLLRRRQQNARSQSEERKAALVLTLRVQVLLRTLEKKRGETEETRDFRPIMELRNKMIELQKK
ncbi:hypothetical protein Theba_2273 [Mesotoga prima MesG1.Ag.4.2]|uniref:Uncharacterized protein n=1 Tax=Mesotoga prima MesG1.Ag.4.2 TaxID=660470 RepID=I2F7J9_9BACT|nr:hypothetical protein Theba_2273 [Mesotoga prima MesG1.Ag.4.2]